jgi:hypothetical protein
MSKQQIVYCTTCYESHTFFHKFAIKLTRAEPELIKQMSEKKDSFITCCTRHFFCTKQKCIVDNL